jgi:hypothetical protein
MLLFAGPAPAPVFKVFLIFALFRLQNVRRRIKSLKIKYFIDELLFFEPVYFRDAELPGYFADL